MGKSSASVAPLSLLEEYTEALQEQIEIVEGLMRQIQDITARADSEEVPVSAIQLSQNIYYSVVAKQAVVQRLIGNLRSTCEKQNITPPPAPPVAQSRDKPSSERIHRSIYELVMDDIRHLLEHSKPAISQLDNLVEALAEKRKV